MGFPSCRRRFSRFSFLFNVLKIAIQSPVLRPVLRLCYVCATSGPLCYVAAGRVGYVWATSGLRINFATIFTFLGKKYAVPLSIADGVPPLSCVTVLP